MSATTTRFGRALLDQWALDPKVLYLNHGTVGAPPRRVLEAQRRIRDEIELQPAKFLLRELTAVADSPPPVPRMRAAASDVAPFLGARGEDLVFVENATTGANAVLQSFQLAPGDEILINDHTYGGVANAARYAARLRGATVRVMELPYPAREDAIVEAFVAAIGPRTRLVVVDHISSSSALVMPLREIAARCRARGVAVLADGAHAPGAIPVDLPSLGVDWYVGNLHKWAWTPRSSGILWAPPERQATLHPTVISWGLDQGWTTEFDLLGTRDPSAYLAAPEALAFMAEFGVTAVQDHNHRLAWEAARLLCDAWKTPLELTESLVGTMATVPLPERAGSSLDDAIRLRDGLLFGDGIEVQLHPWRGRLWTRVSAQVYNAREDYERLARAALARIDG